MPQFVSGWAIWLRHRLPLSNSPQAWTERGAGAGLLAAVAMLIWFGDSLAASRRFLLWGLLLVAAAGLLRRGWVQLFGPVLFYELVRLGRRGRYVAVRCLYAFALLVFLLCVYAIWQDTARIVHGAMAPRDLANFAASFFYVFAGLQLGMVIFLTPAYTAGVLAEEKERGNLEALLATDLRNREIVLGLFLARLINLTLLLLAGLPILSFLQFLGGVDPNLVVSAFVATGCTMLSLASVSFLCSLYARRSRDAIVRSYLLSLGYLVLSGLSWLLLLPQLQLAGFPSTDDWISPITVQDVVEWFNYGNIVSLAVHLAMGVLAGKNLGVLIWDSVTKYAWFHGLIAAGCCTWAVVRLRAKALEQLAGDSKHLGRLGRVRLELLPLRNRPVLWKEIAVEAGSRRGLLGLLVQGCLLALLAVPTLQVMYYHGQIIPAQPDSRLADLINLWVRGAGVLLGCLLLLQVAVRAAGSVSGERGRRTLDGLLATSLDNREILAGKWLGSILGPRRPWLGLAVVWSIGLVTGALHPLAPVCFVAAWLVYAAFLAALGLWASAANRSTHRATFWTLFLVGAAMVGSWLAAFDVVGRWLKTPEALCLSPPPALYLLLFSPADVKHWAESGSEWSFRGIILGLAGWGTAAWVLWAVAKIRFRVVTGREAKAEKRRVGVRVGELGPALLPTLTPTPSPSPSPDAAEARRVGVGVGVRGGVGGIGPDTIPTPTLTPTPSPEGFPSSVRSGLEKEFKEDVGVGVGVRIGVGVRPRETPPIRRFPLRACLRLAARTGLGLLPLAVLIGEYVRLDRAANQKLREALAETDRLDPGWRLEELEAKRQVVPPEQNSALQVMKAYALVPQGWWKTEHDLRFAKLAPNRQLSAKQLDTLRKGLKPVEAALAKARRLADMPCGRFPTPVRNAGRWQNPYPFSQEALSVGKLLEHEIDLRVQEGDADGALVACRALLNAGRAIGDEPQPMSQISRMFLVDSAISKMERALAQGEPAEATLEPLQRLLADEDRHPAVLIGQRGERASADLLLQRLQDGTQTGIFYPGQRGNAVVAGLPRDEELRLIASGSLKARRAALLRVDTSLVEAAKLPPGQMETRQEQILTKLRGSNAPVVVRLLSLMAVWRPNNALVRSAVAALAAERYRRRHGRWPETLEALVPAFLPEVPAVDPADGKRLRYSRLKEGIVIYSIGPNAKGNSGSSGGQIRTRPSKDLGVQLWDVNRRRQPPAPEKSN